MQKKTRKITKNFLHWVMVTYILFYVLTGFGITHWQTVEPLTLGLLGKASAMRIHDNMEIPFLILIGTHVLVSLMLKDKEGSA